MLRSPCLLLLALLVVAGLGLACSGDPGPRLDAREALDGTSLDGLALDGGVCEGTLPYLSECTENGQCADSCLCFPFNTLGPHCTRECDGPEDCPEPSRGCGARGVCSPP